MKYVALICRILLGALFVFSGVMKIHPFKPMPEIPPGLVADWLHVMMTSGWLMVVAWCEVIGGLLVIVGGTVPLGLCILCPITVNILCFHALLTGGKDLAGGLMTAVFELVLIYAYRGSFAGILSASQKPVV